MSNSLTNGISVTQELIQWHESEAFKHKRTALILRRLLDLQEPARAVLRRYDEAQDGAGKIVAAAQVADQLERVVNVICAEQPGVESRESVVAE